MYNCNISHRWKNKQAICESETKPSAVLISHQRANTVFSNLTANSPWQSLWFCTSVPPSSFAKAASSMLIVDFGGSCMTFSGSVQLLSPPWVTGNGSCRFSMTPLSFISSTPKTRHHLIKIPLVIALLQLQSQQRRRGMQPMHVGVSS